MQEINAFINSLQLQAHPEGGFYREMYRSPTMVQAIHSPNEKSAYTSIYYLLAGQDFSSWHRIKSDETWFFHYGCDVLIYFFDAENILQKIHLGPIGKKFQATIPANTWFAAKPLDETSFCLVSCVVAPGFEFSDFEMGKRQELLVEYGQTQENTDIITSLTRIK